MRGKLLAKRAATQKEAVNSLAPEREANIFAKLPELSVPTDAPLSVLPVPRPTTANGSSPIHPSLPPRPGSSMLKLPSSSSQPTPAPAPTAATPAVVVPVPVFRPASQPTTTTITDKEILKFEEVTVYIFDGLYSSKKFYLLRTNTGGRGLPSVWPEISIYNTSEKLERAILWNSPTRLRKNGRRSRRARRIRGWAS